MSHFNSQKKMNQVLMISLTQKLHLVYLFYMILLLLVCTFQLDPQKEDFIFLNKNLYLLLIFLLIFCSWNTEHCEKSHSSVSGQIQLNNYSAVSSGRKEELYFWSDISIRLLVQISHLSLTTISYYKDSIHHGQKNAMTHIIIHRKYQLHDNQWHFILEMVMNQQQRS